MCVCAGMFDLCVSEWWGGWGVRGRLTQYYLLLHNNVNHIHREILINMHIAQCTNACIVDIIIYIQLYTYIDNIYICTWCGDWAGCGGCGDGLGAWPGLCGGPCCGDGGGCGWPPLGPGLAAGDGPLGGHDLDGSEYWNRKLFISSSILTYHALSYIYMYIHIKTKHHKSRIELKKQIKKHRKIKQAGNKANYGTFFLKLLTFKYFPTMVNLN